MHLKINSFLTKNKSLVFTDQMVFSANSFLTTILMARILSPENFGVFASIMLFVYLVINVLSAIIMQPFQVTLSKIEQKDLYISFSFWLQLCMVILIVIITFSMLQFNFTILDLYKDLDIGILVLTSGFVMQDYFRKLFLACNQVKNSLLIDVMTAILQCAVLVSAIFFTKLELSEIIIWLGLSYLPAIIIGIFMISPKLYDYPTWINFLRSHIHQSKWLLMTAVLQWWSSNLFVVASGLFLGIKALGIFRLVQSLFGIFNVLLQIFENYVLPQTSRILDESQGLAKSYLNRISIRSLILLIVILLPIFIFSETIIVLAGGIKYGEYSNVVKGMSLLYLVIFLGYPIRIAIRALVLNRNFFIGYLFSLIFSLLSFNYLLNEWDLMGAIAGLVMSQSILISYWQYILVKQNFILWK